MDRPIRVRKICLPIFLFLSTIPFSGFLNDQVQERKFELQANSPQFWNLLDRDAKLYLVAGGFGFTEGPVWDEAGFSTSATKLSTRFFGCIRAAGKKN